MTSWKKVALSIAAVAFACAAQAQDYPVKPITLIVPWPAGGSTDISMRAIAEAASKHLGQPIVIDNKAGGGGTVGPATMAATAKPDGYTLLMGNQGPMSVNPTLFPRFRVNPETALEPVALVADAPLVVVAGPTVPPPPALLSTTIGCPRCFEAASAIARMLMSVDPPAGQGTMRVIGFTG